MLHPVGSQRVGRDLATEQQTTTLLPCIRQTLCASQAGIKELWDWKMLSWHIADTKLNLSLGLIITNYKMSVTPISWVSKY